MTYIAYLMSSSGTHFSIDVETRALKNRNINRSVGGYEGINYCTKRDMAISSDGTRIPLTVFSLSSEPSKQSSPTLLVGYGAYGVPVNVGYDPGLRTLLHRNWTIAFAHVRLSIIICGASSVHIDVPYNCLTVLLCFSQGWWGAGLSLARRRKRSEEMEHFPRFCRMCKTSSHQWFVFLPVKCVLVYNRANIPC